MNYEIYVPTQGDIVPMKEGRAPWLPETSLIVSHKFSVAALAESSCNMISFWMTQRLSPWVMNLIVSFMVNELKILRSIILFVSVNMMNYFYFIQKSTNNLFNCEAMLINILMKCIWMVRHINFYISFVRQKSPAFPIPMFLSPRSRSYPFLPFFCELSSFSRKTHFHFGFFGVMASFVSSWFSLICSAYFFSSFYGVMFSLVPGDTKIAHIEIIHHPVSW